MAVWLARNASYENYMEVDCDELLRLDNPHRALAEAIVEVGDE